ncbi:MAG: hypothetical protein BMS9Abin31_0822 [Gammaproteobacteria bacterium]|nr:MAG: hypothetical protein BMS9Abin31_0822 [Gammaproteobacteria bacterium]
MTHFRNFTRHSFFITVSLFITACGGGGNGSPSVCDSPLTVQYVDKEFSTEDTFVLGKYTASNTTIIHQDGNQGNTFDIDTIILSRITHTSGNSLALSYSIHATTSPTNNDTFVAFYIDTDNLVSTGESMNGIGADAVILDSAELLNVSLPLSVNLERFQIWKTAANEWLPQPTLGTLNSSASYLNQCSLNLAVYTPLYQGLSALSGKSVRGVMKLIRLTNADPDTPVATAVLDSTAVFNFAVP